MRTLSQAFFSSLLMRKCLFFQGLRIRGAGTASHRRRARAQSGRSSGAFACFDSWCGVIAKSVFRNSTRARETGIRGGAHSTENAAISWAPGARAARRRAPPVCSPWRDFFSTQQRDSGARHAECMREKADETRICRSVDRCAGHAGVRRELHRCHHARSEVEFASAAAGPHRGRNAIAAGIATLFGIA